jgi:hypothetical protein
MFALILKYIPKVDASFKEDHAPFASPSSLGEFVVGKPSTFSSLADAQAAAEELVEAVHGRFRAAGFTCLVYGKRHEAERLVLTVVEKGEERVVVEVDVQEQSMWEPGQEMMVKHISY